MKILVNINHKGGVGKTTNTIHIGAELNNRGYKVLLIDADNQCDLTVGIGVREVGNFTIIDFLQCKEPIEVTPIAENFYIVPGNHNFQSPQYDKEALKKAIDFYDLKNYFDYILIDIPPTGVNESYVSPAELALCAADYIIIPLQADMYSIKNVFPFMDSILRIKEYNPKLNFLGMYFSNVLVNTNTFIQSYKELREKNDKIVFKAFIRRDMEVIKASYVGKTIFEYNDSSRAADDFRSLVDEILSKVKEVEQVNN